MASRDFTDSTGTWHWVPGARFAPRGGPLSEQAAVAPDFDLDAPPPEVAAEDQLPLMIKDGQLYRLDARDFHPFPEGVSMKAGPGLPGRVPPEDVAVYPPLDRVGLDVPQIGTDNRVLRKSTTWPYPPQGYLHTSLGNCSATYIGWDTAITAAHCFYHAGQYGYFDYLIPGRDNSLSNPSPYGEQYCATAVGFPGQFPSSGGHDFYDYAVITFHACADRAGWQSGNLGVWINPPESALTLNGAYSIYGYPRTCAPSGFKFGRPCGKSGTGHYYRNGITGAIQREYVLSDNIYTSSGQSGTAHYVFDPADNGYWVVGAHTANAQGHAMDSAFWTLVQQISQDY